MRHDRQNHAFLYPLMAFFSVVLLVLGIFAPFALADDENQIVFKDAPKIRSSEIVGGSAILFDIHSGEVYFSKNPQAKSYPASVTKIMTLIVALENADLEDQLTLTGDIADIDSASSKAGFYIGEVLTFEDVLHGLMLPSGNDAANAVAIHVSGSLEGFVELMNQKAAELGMKDSHFMNAHGLHDENHYTTAADMQKLLSYCYGNEAFKKIVSTWEYEIAPTNKNEDGYKFCNGNLLLSPDANQQFRYPAATGVKTGFTNEAGNCLVASAEQGQMALGTVTFNSTNMDKWRDVIKMFYYGFENFAQLPLADLMQQYRPESLTLENVSGDDPLGGRLTLNFEPYESGVYKDTKSNAQMIGDNLEKIDIVKQYNMDIPAAPVENGDVLGTYKFVLAGKVLQEGDLVATRTVEAKAPLFQWQGENDGTQPAVQSLKWVMWVVLGAFILLLALLVLRGIVLRRRRRQAKLRQSALPIVSIEEARKNRRPAARYGKQTQTTMLRMGKKNL
jgi:D-alanyl-D-alanine carboxypeptidase (penicillin-binding protein 5/6)